MVDGWRWCGWNCAEKCKIHIKVEVTHMAQWFVGPNSIPLASVKKLRFWTKLCTPSLLQMFENN